VINQKAGGRAGEFRVVHFHGVFALAGGAARVQTHRREDIEARFVADGGVECIERGGFVIGDFADADGG